MGEIFQSKSSKILSVVLILQAVFFYGFSRTEKVPSHKPLIRFALDDSDWRLVQDLQMDRESLDVLKADDILSRLYQNKSNGSAATLFVAFFETQRTGKVPHSPKNCLPGSGWAPSQSGSLDIIIPGREKPIAVNRYVVSRGQNQSVVLYWYQSRDRVIASEYSAKIYTVADSIRLNRSDTALVRVVVAVDNGNTQAATDTAVSFVQSFFNPLRDYLPS